MYDVVVIGGGAAGFFSAINIKIKNPRLRVLILEKSNKLLSKVAISGGGRCNVTHHCFEPRQLQEYYPRGRGELLSVFNRFNPVDTIDWFSSKGVALKAESDGRMFPVTDDSGTIINCFLKLAEKHRLEIRTSCALKSFALKGNVYTLETEAGPIKTTYLVMTGGSSPALWNILKEAGHSIVDPVPSLFTFNIKHRLLEDLMGISFPKASVTVLADETLIKTFRIKKAELRQQGPLLITHWGLSGPAVLKMSSVAARLLHSLNYRFKIRVSFIHETLGETEEGLRKFKMEHSKKQVINHPVFGLSSRFWMRVCHLVFENPEKNWADVSGKEMNALCNALCSFEFDVNGKSTFKEEFVTAGGVDLKEIDFRNMESKLFKGLYFAGEILNIDALTGGFNFQACWSEAWVISESFKE